MWADRGDEIEDDGELLLRQLQALVEALPWPGLGGGVLGRRLLGLLGVPLDDPGEVDAADRRQPLLLAAGVPAAACSSVSKRFGSREGKGKGKEGGLRRVVLVAGLVDGLEALDGELVQVQPEVVAHGRHLLPLAP